MGCPGPARTKLSCKYGLLSTRRAAQHAWNGEVPSCTVRLRRESTCCTQRIWTCVIRQGCRAGAGQPGPRWERCRAAKRGCSTCSWCSACCRTGAPRSRAAAAGLAARPAPCSARRCTPRRMTGPATRARSCVLFFYPLPQLPALQLNACIGWSSSAAACGVGCDRSKEMCIILKQLSVERQCMP